MTALGVVVLTVVVQLILARAAASNLNRVLQDRTDAVVSSAESVTTGSILTVPDSHLDAGVAVYDDRGQLTAGTIPAALSTQYKELSRVALTRTDTATDSSRILARPFTTKSGASGVVVATERAEPYEESERYALAICVGAGLLMVIVAAALAAWVSRRALAPVAAMAHTASEWSEHDLGRRFGLGEPTTEIAELGATLDGLLDKVAFAIRSEQRLTSELAHELRTPLTVIQGTADLALLRGVGLSTSLRDDLEAIADGARRMAQTIAGLLELARSESTAATAESCEISDAINDVSANLGHPSQLSVDVPTQLRAGLPRALAVRAIVPLVQNAVEIADHVRISATKSGHLVTVFVDDDGPGISRERREAIFQPGHTDKRVSGAGLGLALSRRVARSMGGDVWVDSEYASTRFIITLPEG